MRPSFLFLILAIASHAHADLAQCQKTAKKSVDQCTQRASDVATMDQLASNQAYQNCITTEAASVSNCAHDLAGVGAKSNSDLAKGVSDCMEDKKQCNTDCDPSKGKDDKEKGQMKKQLADCGKKIDDVADQMKKAQPGAKDATDGGNKTSQASGQQPSSQSPQAPQAPQPPQSGQQSNNSPSTNSSNPPNTDSNSNPANTAAGTQPAPTDSSPKDGFKNSTASALCGAGATDIAGCPKGGGATSEGTSGMQYPVTAGGSSSGSSTGGPGGGGNGASGMQSGPAATLDPKVSEADLAKYAAGMKDGKGGQLTTGGDSGFGSYGGGSGSHSSLDELFNSNSRSPASAIKPGVGGAPKIVTASDSSRTQLLSSEGGIHQVSKVVSDTIKCKLKASDCVRK